ncbi:hypothetical protein MHBO_002592 [Bonamia ostreae]|uniref:Ribosomal protein L14 n=1 Tax=Bonamia ostreae TaxID=126728 RepID=A0ABV2AMT8_9EUKA
MLSLTIMRRKYGPPGENVILHAVTDTKKGQEKGVKIPQVVSILLTLKKNHAQNNVEAIKKNHLCLH